MNEARDVHGAADGSVAMSGTLGGAAAVAVSVILGISLPLRDVDFSPLSLFTIVLAAAAGLIAIRGSRREDGAGLGWGAVLLLVAIVPTVFGWVVLLYLPALFAVLIAVVLFITKSSTSS